MQKKSKTAFRKIRILISLIGFVTMQVALGQTKTEKLDALLNSYQDYGKFNGSVLVAEKGKIIYKKGFGMANLEWDMPNSPSTKHRLGSITKQFTAELILQLVAEGTLELDVPITNYLPNYPTVMGNTITIHHLLTHSSGIPNYTSFPKFFEEDSRDPFTPEEFVKVFADSTLQFTPGEKFAYSNSGYFLLGVIIEKITGKSYETVLQEKILDPLQMQNTGYDHHSTILKNRATGYEKEGTNYVNAPYLDMSIPYAAGSLYATVEDLYRWDQALYNYKVLTKAYQDLAFEKHIPAFGGSYGYGWVISTDAIGSSTDSIQVISHGGGINGFNTLISRIPADKNLIVLLNNTGGAPLEEIKKAITGILYSKRYDFPKKSVATAVYEIISTKGVTAGLQQFEKIKKEKDYDLNENEMNNVGYQLLRSDKIQEALAIFKLNTTTFPNSSNVYDSYGEALMTSGDTIAAIENYKKSLELNPGNENAIVMLQKMEVDTSGLVKEITIDSAILESYVGKYELAPNFILSVTKDGDQMKTQATGQSEVAIYPRNENTFYLKVVVAELTFNKNEAGEVISVTLNQGGQQITGIKLKE